MSTDDGATIIHSQTGPVLERSRVSDAMREGVLTCSPETPMRTVAELMSGHRIHCVVVAGSNHVDWGIVSDMDLVRAAEAEDLDLPAERIAATEFVTVQPRDSLRFAAQLMTAHDVAHLVVADRNREPVGVLSTLDIARCVARDRPAVA